MVSGKVWGGLVVLFLAGALTGIAGRPFTTSTSRTIKGTEARLRNTSAS